MDELRTRIAADHKKIVEHNSEFRRHRIILEGIQKEMMEFHKEIANLKSEIIDCSKMINQLKIRLDNDEGTIVNVELFR